jgi:hypothetical protein
MAIIIPWVAYLRQQKDIKEQRGCQINLNPEKTEPQT